MTTETNTETLGDIFAPTTEEYPLIAGGAFVLKTKPANVVISSYHKWRDIWADKLEFIITGENKAVVYRTIALSMPLHLGWPTDDRHAIPYSGFVLGLSMQGGETRVLPLNAIQWTLPATHPVQAAAAEDPNRVCDASSMSGCNSQ